MRRTLEDRSPSVDQGVVIDLVDDYKTSIINDQEADA